MNKIFVIALLLLVLIPMLRYSTVRAKYVPEWNATLEAEALREIQYNFWLFDVPTLSIVVVLFILGFLYFVSLGLSRYQIAGALLGGGLGLISPIFLLLAHGGISTSPSYALQMVIAGGFSIFSIPNLIIENIWQYMGWQIWWQIPNGYMFLNLRISFVFGGLLGMLFGFLIESKEDIRKVLLIAAGFFIFSGGFLSFGGSLSGAYTFSAEGPYPTPELYSQYFSVAVQSFIIGISGLVIFIIFLRKKGW